MIGSRIYASDRNLLVCYVQDGSVFQGYPRHCIPITIIFIHLTVKRVFRMYGNNAISTGNKPRTNNPTDLPIEKVSP